MCSKIFLLNSIAKSERAAPIMMSASGRLFTVRVSGGSHGTLGESGFWFNKHT